LSNVNVETYFVLLFLWFYSNVFITRKAKRYTMYSLWYRTTTKVMIYFVVINSVLSSFITYQRFTRVTRSVPLVVQEQLILPGHLRPSPDISAFRLSKALVFCIFFCRSLFVLSLLAITLSVLRFRTSKQAVDTELLAHSLVFHIQPRGLCI
jgi:hypothetical protein